MVRVVVLVGVGPVDVGVTVNDGEGLGVLVAGGMN